MRNNKLTGTIRHPHSTKQGIPLIARAQILKNLMKHWYVHLLAFEMLIFSKYWRLGKDDVFNIRIEHEVTMRTSRTLEREAAKFSEIDGLALAAEYRAIRRHKRRRFILVGHYTMRFLPIGVIIALPLRPQSPTTVSNGVLAIGVIGSMLWAVTLLLLASISRRNIWPMIRTTAGLTVLAVLLYSAFMLVGSLRNGQIPQFPGAEPTIVIPQQGDTLFTWEYWRVALVYSPLMAIALLAVLGLTASFNQYKMKTRNARAELILNLAAALQQLALAVKDTTSRATAISRIRQAASTLRIGFADIESALAAPDKTVFRNRLRLAAAEVESYTLWVALPQRQTFENLSRNILTILEVVRLGNFDLLPLPQSKARYVNTRGGLRRPLNLARKLISAILPAVLYTAGRELGIQIPQTLDSILFIFAAAWLVIGVIALIDNDYRDRISVVKELISSLPRAGGKE